MASQVNEGLSKMSLSPPVRVLPSAERHLDPLGAAAHLQPAETAWLASVKSRSHPPLPVRPILEAAECPYTSALRLIAHCPAIGEFRPRTPQMSIIRELEQMRAPCQINSAVRRAAFDLAVDQSNVTFLHVTADLFELRNDGEAFLSTVRDLLGFHKYKLAGNIVIALELHNSISPSELVVPVFLQGNWNILDNYFQSKPAHVLHFVKYLDSLLEDRNTISKIHSFLMDHPTPDINWDRLSRRNIGKFMTKLCKEYNIPFDVCENLTLIRASSGMRHLIRQKYEKQAISDDVWNDLVADTINNSPGVLLEFVNTVMMYDAREALKWAQLYNLPEDQYPSTLITISQEPPNTPEEENWDSPAESSEPKYYKLSLSMENIIFVDNMDILNDHLNELTDLSVVGIDSEWKPTFGTKPSTVSLIQIATYYNVFIFDAMVLKHEREAWNILCDKIFNNADVIKLGFGLETDIAEITSSIFGLRDIKSKGASFLELSQLWKHITNNPKNKLPFSKARSGESLSSIVEQCFDVPLNKNEQRSNWENRPLRPSQLEYAALDAYVLLEIYELLRDVCMNNNLEFDDICYRVMNKSKQMKTEKAKRKRRAHRNRPIRPRANVDCSNSSQ